MVIIIPSERQTCPSRDPKCISMHRKIMGVGTAIGAAAIGIATVGYAVSSHKAPNKLLHVGIGAALTAGGMYTAHHHLKSSKLKK